MLIGVPKEIKNHEYRVGLVPASVRELVHHGHKVLVETGAGEGIGLDDRAYKAAGATIAKTAEDVFAKSEMVIKVKEPQPRETKMLRKGQILYTYLHLAPDPEQTKGLLGSGVTAIAYETVTDDRGGLPLLAPMSEVAGRLAIQAGATSLQKANGGRGILLGGVPGVLPAKVAVIGGGVVGLHAARMAVGLGADVTVLDRSLPRLRQHPQAVCCGRVEDQGQVDLEVDHRLHGLVAVQHLDVEGHGREAGLEIDDGARQEDRRQRLAAGHAHLAAAQAPQRLDLRAHVLQVGGAPARIADEEFARRRQPHAPWQALEDRRAQLALQVLHAAVDRRRGDLQLFGGAAHGAAAGNCIDIVEESVVLHARAGCKTDAGSAAQCRQTRGKLERSLARRLRRLRHPPLSLTAKAS